MRIPVVCTVLALGLLSCHRTTVYLSADDLFSVPHGVRDSAPCNDLQQQGNDVDLAGSRDAPPTPTGGIIEDGTYVLTSSTVYTKDRSHGASLVPMGRITMLVNGSTSQLVRNAAGGRERRNTVNRVSSGSIATLPTVCASPTPNGSESTSTTRYTATGTSLRFITPGPAGTVVATYTKL